MLPEWQTVAVRADYWLPFESLKATKNMSFPWCWNSAQRLKYTEEDARFVCFKKKIPELCHSCGNIFTALLNVFLYFYFFSAMLNAMTILHLNGIQGLMPRKHDHFSA